MTLFQHELSPSEIRAGGEIQAAPASAPGYDAVLAIEARARAARAATLAAAARRTVARAARPFVRFRRWLDECAARRQALAALARMSDRQLADIGLTRAHAWLPVR